MHLLYISALQVHASTQWETTDEKYDPKPGDHSSGRPSSILTDFLDMKDTLQTVLQDSDVKMIVEHCGSLNASDKHNIPLLSADFIEMLKEETQATFLLQKLSAHFTWSNHSVLYEVVKVCHNCGAATRLLTDFDARVDSSQYLESFPIPAPHYTMLPYENSSHTVLAVQLDVTVKQCTLRHVIDVCTLIQSKCEISSHTLQLLSVANSSSAIVCWMLSKCVVPLVTSKFSQKSLDFYQKGIVQVSIYPDTILLTGGTLKVGLLSFFSTYFDYHVSIVTAFQM